MAVSNPINRQQKAGMTGNCSRKLKTGFSMPKTLLKKTFLKESVSNNASASGGITSFISLGGPVAYSHIFAFAADGVKQSQ